MGFPRGFLLGIPVGLYFGEKALNYPITYTTYPNRYVGYLQIDFIFLDVLLKDVQGLVKKSTSK